MKKRLGLAAISLAVVLTLCWSVFAEGSGKDSPSGIKTIIHQYISGNAETKNCLQTSMKLLEDIYSGKRSYSAALITSQLETLSAYKNRIETECKYLVELKSLYLKEFSIVQNALTYAQLNSEKTITQSDRDYISSLAAQADKIDKEEDTAYISLFKNAGMKYSISQDGSINYEYK
ncbi:MAG: hypothetical protein H6Q58_2077 [Firmicutes bacterium]|nr:hypothetical protein [Bacillota bacterium]